LVSAAGMHSMSRIFRQPSSFASKPLRRGVLACLTVIAGLSAIPAHSAGESLYETKENASRNLEPSFGFLTSEKDVYQSQVLLQEDDSLLLVWVQRRAGKLDLLVSRQAPGEPFSPPLQINRSDLNGFTGDEARPSVALAPDGTVAIAWTAANNDIMLAVGFGFGKTFDAPVKLNQDDGEAFRTMPSVALAPDGVAHTVWLDPREAPKGMEEPSDLYYASVTNGAVREVNLTASQEPTVCGCCRPFIAMDENASLDIVFRNANADGYRDISRITGPAGSLSEPQPTSPPIWKLNACPSAGPILTGGGVLWKDASTGAWRLLWSDDPGKVPGELFPQEDEIDFTFSPRLVSGRPNWVLIGGRPLGLIAERVEDDWKLVRNDLPRWASSAVVRDNQLILVGNEKGQLYTSVQTL